MSVTQPFYSHEPDSRILMKKDKLEVRNWKEDLEYVNQELEYFVEIEDRLRNDPEVLRQLHTLGRENQLVQEALFRHEYAMRNAMECDTTECDAYYLHRHEMHRNKYRDHIHGYRQVKIKVLTKILEKAKRS